MSEIFQIGGIIMIVIAAIGFAVASIGQIRLARKIEAGLDPRES